MSMGEYRHSGSWMSIWDDRILEILSEEGPKTPSKIANREYICVGSSNISKRLSKLSDNNLVDPLGNGVYELNKKGASYLIGKYDAEKLEYIEDNNIKSQQNTRSDYQQSALKGFSQANGFDYTSLINNEMAADEIENPE